MLANALDYAAQANCNLSAVATNTAGDGSSVNVTITIASAPTIEGNKLVVAMLKQMMSLVTQLLSAEII